MTDTANETMTPAEYREETEGANLAYEYDSAVAIDPGTTTGVAAFDEVWDELNAFTLDFWEVIQRAEKWRSTREFVCIVEAPYATEWGKAQDNSAMAYNSGQVAREAELLVGGLRRKGLDVIEHDPHSSGNSAWSGGKWDSKTARQIVGDWEGPDNEHVRDSLRMLCIYGFVG